jgi:hypothetical protein
MEWSVVRRGVWLVSCTLVTLIGANAASTWRAPAAAPDRFVTDPTVDEHSEPSVAPGHSHPSNQPDSLEEPERSGKPERRQRIRDAGPEDELQARSRKLLA